MATTKTIPQTPAFRRQRNNFAIACCQYGSNQDRKKKENLLTFYKKVKQGCNLKKMRLQPCFNP